MVEKQELKKVGSVSGIRGVDKLWKYINSLLEPLGFKSERSTLSYNKLLGKVNGRDICVEFYIRKKTKNIGVGTDHLIDLRLFSGLDMQITFPIKTKTRCHVTIPLSRSVALMFKPFALLMTSASKVVKFVPQSNFYSNREVWCVDTTWAAKYLDNSEVINSLKTLTPENLNIERWGLQFKPESFYFNRRLTQLKGITSDTLAEDFEQITQLADIAEQTAVSFDAPLFKSEQRIKDNPKSAMLVAWIKLVAILLALPALIISIIFIYKNFIAG